MGRWVWFVLTLLAILSAACGSSREPRGSVRVILHNERPVREGFGLRVRRMLAAHKFAELESLADSLSREDYHWPSGRRMIDTFYEDGFGDVPGPEDPERWAQHLQDLRKWLDESRSPVARYALVWGLIGRAGAARGTGWAHEVSSDQWRRHATDIEEAEKYLRLVRDEARDSYEWYSTSMRVLHSKGSEADAAYREVAHEALRRYPTEMRFYIGMSSHLMPRWYGQPGDWEHFTETSTSRLPDSLADEFYARVVAFQSRYVENVFQESPSLSWPRTKQGLESWRRHWPTSKQPLSTAALLACLAEDRPSAREFFAGLGDTVELEVWGSGERFLAARNWAHAESP